MDSLRESVRSFLGFSPTASLPEVRWLGREEADGYARSLIRYSASEGEPIEALVLEPATGKSRGAVLALHQHNSQWEIGKSEIAGLRGDPMQAFGPALARRGITVLAPDAVGFESRMGAAAWGQSLAPALNRPHSSAEAWLQYYNQVAYRLVHGDLLMRKLLEDCATGLSVLHQQAGIERLGVIGHSFGGNVALFLAALDTRVAFACASGAVCSYRHKMAAGIGLEGALIIPGFAKQYDLDDLLRCVAPRKLLVMSSEEDPLSADAEEVIRKALPAFEMQGCADHLQHLRTAGTHSLDQNRFEAIVEWTVAQAMAA